MKLIFPILSAIFLLPSCFGADFAFSSRFDNMVPIKVPANARSTLKKRQIDVANIEKMSQPKGWSIRWENYPADCRFYVRDSKFGIKTSGDALIYNTREVRCLSRNYILKLDVTMPADSAEQSSRVAIGIIRYGMISSGHQFIKEIAVKRGESASLEVPFHFDHGVPTFMVLLKIHGDVILKELTVTEQPDDLAKAGITVLEGTLKEISQLPDPKKSDYPDCRFTALLEGDSIIDGAQCPKEIQLVIDGFRNYKTMATARLKPGDKIRCFVTPFEKLPDARKSVQQADDLNLFELPSYYALEIDKVQRFSQNSAIPFAGKQEYVSVFERKINPPLSAEDREMQRQAIADSLARIEKMLAPYSDEAELKKLNARFAEAWKAEKAKDPPGYNRLNGGYVWRNIDNSFWALPENYMLVQKHSGIGQDKLDALCAFQEFLNAHGCQLMIGIVPKLHAISARVINREFRDVPDFNSAWLTRELLKNGLEAFYISDKLLKNYNRFPFAFFYPDNDHPADTAQDIMSDIISEALRRYHFPKTLNKERFSINLVPHSYEKNKRHSFPVKCDIGTNRAGEDFLCRQVLYDGKAVFPNPQSPILVLGNSFIKSPMKDPPDAFPSLLASKTHTTIASLRFSGACGPMTNGINQFFSHHQKYLRGKHVLILILGARHFENVHFNNIRLMDEQMLLMAEKTQVATFPVCGNEKKIPVCFKSLIRVQCFTVPASGKQPVIAQLLPPALRGTILVIPVCTATSPCPAQLKTNGMTLTIPESFGVPRWSRIVATIPNDAERLTVELEGKPGTTIALGDIQIFK